MEHKLGISFWCIGSLFSYVHRLFDTLQRTLPKGDDGRIGPATALALSRSTRALLLINPDSHTCWNVRKRLLAQHKMSGGLEAELSLLSVIFTKHPKSGAAWAHRRWVLLRAEPFRSRDGGARPTNPTAIDGKSGQDKHEIPLFKHPSFAREMDICEKSASAYKKNYYAWTHRRWVLERVTTRAGLEAEILKLRKWNCMHVSEHCGFHYKQQALLQLLRLHGGAYAWVAHVMAQVMNGVDSSQIGSARPAPPSDAWVLRLLETELKESEDLVGRYPGHESLWIDRRFLFGAYARALLCDSDRSRRDRNWIHLLTSELSLAEEARKDDQVSRFDMQRRAAVAYKIWCLDVVLRQLGIFPRVSRRDDKPIVPAIRDDTQKPRLPDVSVALLLQWRDEAVKEVAEVWGKDFMGGWTHLNAGEIAQGQKAASGSGGS